MDVVWGGLGEEGLRMVERFTTAVACEENGGTLMR